MSALTLTAVTVPLSLVVICCGVCLAVFLVRKKRSTPPSSLETVPRAGDTVDQSTTSFIPAQPLVSKEPILPGHRTLRKDNTLKKKVKELAGDKKLLGSEFNHLMDFVEKNIVKESTVAKLTENKPHNRYVDMGKTFTIFYDKFVFLVPFDDNYITLASKIFQTEDETNYINASKIVFTGYSQAFIATQAPKPISFNHFWHMVIEQKVKSSWILR